MSKIFFIWLLIVIINCSRFATAKDWCSVDCHVSPGPHVLCNFSPDVVSRSCGKVTQSGLTPEDKKEILNTHNELRQKVASGQEKQGRPGPQPAARHMPNLIWDDQLAKLAQAWANQCDTDNHRCSHLSSDYSDQVGQNLGWTGYPNKSFKDVVHRWYNEVAHFDKNKVKNFGSAQGHYTQLVWAKTTKVGCGGMKFLRDGYEAKYLVCNYSPAGNLPGAAVY